jgi:hypothetical protein
LPGATAPARRTKGNYDGKQDSDVAALPGRSSFQLLQAFKSSRAAPLVYCVFDLLFLEGKDLREQPLSARRKLLARLSCLKKLLRTSGSLVSFAAVRTNCFGLLKNSASRGWSPKDQIQATKAADAAAPGSNSRSPRVRSSLSAVTLCLRGAGATSALCLVGYNGPDGLMFRRQSWNWFFRKTSGQYRCAIAQDQTYHLPLCQPAGENERSVGTRNHPCRHETLPVGKTRTGRPGPVHRVDS